MHGRAKRRVRVFGRLARKLVQQKGINMKIDMNITLDIHVGKNGKVSLESFGITPTKNLPIKSVADFRVKLDTISDQSKKIRDYLENTSVFDVEVIDALSGKLVWLIEHLINDYEAAQKSDDK